mmetsp:Transcript_101782/g.318030  ORF Transcript_101782/g.318030 Transcript_101782/m.318030 type:complete len:401 (+) Transcript_101782:366-1568(+)
MNCTGRSPLGICMQVVSTERGPSSSSAKTRAGGNSSSPVTLESSSCNVSSGRGFGTRRQNTASTWARSRAGLFARAAARATPSLTTPGPHSSRAWYCRLTRPTCSSLSHMGSTTLRGSRSRRYGSSTRMASPRTGCRLPLTAAWSRCQLQMRTRSFRSPAWPKSSGSPPNAAESSPPALRPTATCVRRSQPSKAISTNSESASPEVATPQGTSDTKSVMSTWLSSFSRCTDQISTRSWCLAAPAPRSPSPQSLPPQPSSGRALPSREPPASANSCGDSWMPPSLWTADGRAASAYRAVSKRLARGMNFSEKSLTSASTVPFSTRAWTAHGFSHSIWNSASSCVLDSPTRLTRKRLHTAKHSPKGIPAIMSLICTVRDLSWPSPCSSQSSSAVQRSGRSTR